MLLTYFVNDFQMVPTIIITNIIMSLVTGLFFLVILLNQQWSPPFRLQASHCSTFRIMCDVPSIIIIIIIIVTVTKF